MKIEFDPRTTRFELYPATTEEFYILKLIYDTQGTLKAENTITELIKNMFKFTIDGREVTADEFIEYYNNRINKAENKGRKFITVHKYDSPNLKGLIFIDQIQAITQRDDGNASIRLSNCKYDTCDKYDKVIKQLT